VVLVKTPEEGVPRAGVTSVGLVLRTFEPLPVLVVTPVPPLVTGRGALRVRAAKVGEEVEAIGCGVERVTAPVEELAIISFAVPVMEETNPPVTTGVPLYVS
jgi:hypothetical protein